MKRHLTHGEKVMNWSHMFVGAQLTHFSFVTLRKMLRLSMFTHKELFYNLQLRWIHMVKHAYVILLHPRDARKF